MKPTQTDIEKATEQAKLLDWELLDLRMLTEHKSDYYLMVSISKVKDDEYGVHLYNSRQEGFSEGYYTNSYENALEKYNSKR